MLYYWKYTLLTLGTVFLTRGLAWGLAWGAAFETAQSPQDTIPHAHHLLKGITITAKKLQPVRPGEGTTITGRDLEAAMGSTLAGMLRTVPGVAALQTGAGIAKPVIHGMHSNRILVLNHGIRQGGQQWGAEHAPEIDPFVAGRISLIKGSESIRFGPGALGGVLIIAPPALPRGPGLHGAVHTAFSSNGRAGLLSGMLNGGIRDLPGFGWRVQGTLKRGGNQRTASYYLENTGLEEINFSAAAGYHSQKIQTALYFSRFKTGIGIFQGAHIGNLTDLEARIISGRPPFRGSFSYRTDAPRQEVSHDLVKLEGTFALSEWLKLQLQYGLQFNRRKEYDIRRGNRNAVPSMDLALTSQTLDIFFERNTVSGWKSQFGASGTIQVNNTTPGTYATPLIPNFDNYQGGVYFIQQFHGKDYTLEAGLRYDRHQLDALGYDQDQEFYGGQREFRYVSASAGGHWHVDQAWHVSANFEMSRRPPVVSELYSNGLHHGTASYEFGDPRLNPERSYKWVGTLNHRKGPWDLALTGYLHRFQHYIYLHPSLRYTTTMQGSFPTFNYQQTEARLAGLDLSASYTPGVPFSLELTGAILRAKDVSNDRYLPWMPADRLTGALSWSPARGESFGNTFFQLQHEYVRRQFRYTPESDFAPPPPGYHLWHLRAGSEWIRPSGSIRFYLSLENMTNVLYKEYMNRFRYYAHDIGRNITFRLAYKF